MPKSWFTLYDHTSYVPIAHAAQNIRAWQRQGAEIVYCTSRQGKQAAEIAGLLNQYGFVGSKLYYRDRGQRYAQLVETVKPEILIEDDCKSIGGSWQMCITRVKPELKCSIHSHVVKEFQGIDHLSHQLAEL